MSNSTNFANANSNGNANNNNASISQIAGIYYPTPIDTWCKTVKGCRYYDAYMDDRIVIHESKTFLKKLLADIVHIARELGIFINPRKTQIVKLSHGFTWLKVRYIITDSGKIIKRIPKSVIVRERRKLKKLAKMVVEGEVSLDAYRNQYKSWREDKKGYNSYLTLRNMDNLFREEFLWIMRTKPTLSKLRESMA